LEAPDDITSFQFNPKYPNLVAGGCVNGQIILWDIAEYEKMLQADKKAMNDTKNGAKKASETPVVKWFIASTVEGSQKSSITDLVWIETPLEVRGLAKKIVNQR
jgi:dynein intermediate chain 3, axonemal